MSHIVSGADLLIGRTPLIVLHTFSGRILAKAELLNPWGSVKDRVARAMVSDAEKRGLLAPGGTIIEPTSGNTGIALAALAAVRGYRCIITMPENMSKERRFLMELYGARIHLTPAELGMQGAIEKARALAASIPGSFLPDQFCNLANPMAHYRTTGPEIWTDSGGNVDIFVAGVGTGGTLTGVGRFLKEKKPSVQIVAVEPAASPVLSGGSSASHGIQGIGAGFVPKNLDRSLLDRVVAVKDEDALRTAELLARMEGIPAGISSGAAVWAASRLARMPENEGKTIVTLLPDGVERYLSTFLADK